MNKLIADKQEMFVKGRDEDHFPGKRHFAKISPESRNRFKKFRMLIVDSGASFHMVDAGQITAAERATKRRLDRPILLQTAKREQK